MDINYMKIIHNINSLPLLIEKVNILNKKAKPRMELMPILNHLLDNGERLKLLLVQMINPHKKEPKLQRLKYHQQQMVSNYLI